MDLVEETETGLGGKHRQDVLPRRELENQDGVGSRGKMKVSGLVWFFEMRDMEARGLQVRMIQEIVDVCECV